MIYKTIMLGLVKNRVDFAHFAIFGVAISMFLVACTNHATQHDIINITYEGRGDINDARQFFNRERGIVPELTPNSILGNISRVIEADSLLLVVDDTNKIVAFDSKSGSMAFSIHNVGQGPGQYINLWDAGYNSDTHEIMVLADKKILFYNLQGQYMDRDISLNGYCNEIMYANGCIYLLKETYANNTLTDSQIEVRNSATGAIVASYMAPLREYAPFCNVRGRTLNQFVDRTGTATVVFSRKFDSNVYELSDLNSNILFAFEWGDLTFEPEDKEYECSELARYTLQNGKIYQTMNMQCGDSTICFTSNLPNLFIMSKNNHWVKQYSGLIDSELNIPLSSMIPITGSKGKVLFMIPYHMMQRYNEHMPNNKNLTETLKSMSEESNPLFIIYTLQ